MLAALNALIAIDKIMMYLETCSQISTLKNMNVGGYI
jgi:hypothetical protein